MIGGYWIIILRIFLKIEEKKDFITTLVNEPS